jgi:hypothetical protein
MAESRSGDGSEFGLGEWFRNWRGVIITPSLGDYFHPKDACCSRLVSGDLLQQTAKRLSHGFR